MSASISSVDEEGTDTDSLTLVDDLAVLRSRHTHQCHAWSYEIRDVLNPNYKIKIFIID